MQCEEIVIWNIANDKENYFSKLLPNILWPIWTHIVLYAKLNCKTGFYIIWIEKKNHCIKWLVLGSIWIVLLKTIHSCTWNWIRKLVFSPYITYHILFEKFSDRYYRQLLALYSQRHTRIWSTPGLKFESR